MLFRSCRGVRTYNFTWELEIRVRAHGRWPSQAEWQIDLGNRVSHDRKGRQDKSYGGTDLRTCRPIPCVAGEIGVAAEGAKIRCTAGRGKARVCGGSGGVPVQTHIIG